jgi:hypothetical protein
MLPEFFQWSSVQVFVKSEMKPKVNHKGRHFVLRNQQLVIIFGAVKKIIQYFFLLFFVPAVTNAQFENVRDSVVQLYGVVMTADSLVGIPAVSIVVKGQNRGTISNNQGVFSIVVLKGDVVEFTHVSYKTKIITVPKNLEGNQYSVVQLMIADTVYLPATIIRPRPSAAQFARDFASLKVPDDDLEIARKNTSVAKRRALMKSTPADGREASNIQLRNVANKAYYAGQNPPQNIFNPAAWAEFIEAWKRGDFKRKN